MQVQPILIVTRDAGLWESWQLLSEAGKKPYRGVDLQDVLHWKSMGNHLVIVDMALLKQSNAKDGWQQYFEGLRVLVLSAHMSDAEGQLVLAKGACGYAHTHLSNDALVLIVNSIDTGAIWLGRSLLQRMLQDIEQRLPVITDSDWAQLLSVREKEVARLASTGHSNSEIAQQLLITERTVRAHLSSVFEKLHVDDRLKLALKVHGIQR